MNRISTSFLLLTLLAMVIAAAPLQKSFKYKSTEGKMQIAFPVEYQVQEGDEGEGPKTVKISATTNDQTFFAAYTLHAQVLHDEAELAQVSLEAFNEQLAGTILSQSTWSYKGSNGMQARIHLDQQNVKIQYKVLIRGNLQYQVVSVAPDGNWDQAAADAFFKSFKIK